MQEFRRTCGTSLRKLSCGQASRHLMNFIEGTWLCATASEADKVPIACSRTSEQLHAPIRRGILGDHSPMAPFPMAPKLIEETQVSGVWRVGRGGIGPFGHLVVSPKGTALVDPPYFSEAKWA